MWTGLRPLMYALGHTHRIYVTLHQRNATLAQGKPGYHLKPRRQIPGFRSSAAGILPETLPR